MRAVKAPTAHVNQLDTQTDIFSAVTASPEHKKSQQAPEDPLALFKLKPASPTGAGESQPPEVDPGSSEMVKRKRQLQTDSGTNKAARAAKYKPQTKFDKKVYGVKPKLRSGLREWRVSEPLTVSSFSKNVG